MYTPFVKRRASRWYGIYFLPWRLSAWVTTSAHPAVILLRRSCKFVASVL
ncbi:Uncharacterized protein DBV15_08986 [Temnothorax longispinosus]|uniref:Uncharacterized protein n=1 Tax=Temnothorax longispinosus TaxID=300112 RepID=A0A4S2JHH4_9HYME|nr:Uncharacterized protein DBV15_08986 [Temnothorax longispinosus]